MTWAWKSVVSIVMYIWGKTLAKTFLTPAPVTPSVPSANKMKEQLLDIRGLVSTATLIARDHNDMQVVMILEMIGEGMTDIIENRYRKLVEPVEPKPRRGDD